MTNTLPKYASYFKPTKTETIQQISVDVEKEKRSKTAQIVKWATAGVCAIASVAAIVATGGVATPLVIGAVSGVSGFVTAGVSDLADQYVEHGNIIEHSDEIDWGGALWKGTLGGIAGFATEYIGGQLSKYMIDTARVSPGIGSLVNSYNPAVRTISGGLVGSVAEVYSGNVSRFAGTYIQTGDFGAAIDEAYTPQNMTIDAIIGGATCAIEARGTKASHVDEVEQVKLTEVSEGGSNSLINIDEIRPKLKTEPNTAFFWSGRTDGIGGADNAAAIAKSRGGVTLESTIESQKIVMPEWDFNNPSTMEAWDLASAAYAEQVSGEIRAIIGAELRPGNIWENVELPRLMKNPNVTKITTIDPKTGVEKIIYERKNMKITGSMNYVKFDLENGYVLKAEGEMLLGRKFVAYKDTMKNWEPPHENEELREEHIESIIQEVQKSMNENTVQIMFE